MLELLVNHLLSLVTSVFTSYDKQKHCENENFVLNLLKEIENDKTSRKKSFSSNLEKTICFLLPPWDGSYQPFRAQFLGNEKKFKNCLGEINCMCLGY